MAAIEKEKALDVVRQMVADGQVSQEVAEKYFPELKESEDERIRKEIIDFICWATDRGCITKEQREKSNSWLAWLEKQGEQKPVEWSEEDEKMRKTAISLLTHPIAIKNNEGARKGVVEWLEHLKPPYFCDTCKLKKSIQGWKPSEEMLEALYRVIPNNVMEKSEDEMLLDKLYQGLKYGKVLSEN